MIFLKRWFADNETMRGEMHEYQEEAIDLFLMNDLMEGFS
jgi:hypothetical protein